ILVSVPPVWRKRPLVVPSRATRRCVARIGSARLLKCPPSGSVSDDAATFDRTTVGGAALAGRALTRSPKTERRVPFRHVCSVHRAMLVPLPPGYGPVKSGPLVRVHAFPGQLLSR